MTLNCFNKYSLSLSLNGTDRIQSLEIPCMMRKKCLLWLKYFGCVSDVNDDIQLLYARYPVKRSNYERIMSLELKKSANLTAPDRPLQDNTNMVSINIILTTRKKRIPPRNQIQPKRNFSICDTTQDVTNTIRTCPKRRRIFLVH